MMHLAQDTSIVPAGPVPTVVPDKPVIQEITDVGAKTFWVLFVLMLISSIVFIFMAFRAQVAKRLLYQLITLATIISTLSYYALAVGDGRDFVTIMVRHSHRHMPDTYTEVMREVSWAHYVDWAITTPLILLSLALLAGMNGSSILTLIVADVIMILTGLFAAISGGTRRQRWGWYAMGCVAFLFIVWEFVSNGRVAAQKRRTNKLFFPLMAYTIIIWAVYPIIWGIAEGAHKMSPNAEVITYAILDILAKPIFGLWLLIGYQRLAESALHLGGWWSEGFGTREGTLRVGDDED